MAKVIGHERGMGTISRIFFESGDTGFHSILLTLQGSTRLIKAGIKEVDNLTSLKLSKSGDEVRFVLRLQKSFMMGEHAELIEFTNLTLNKELDGVPRAD
jgi:hypothetical protein